MGEMNKKMKRNDNKIERTLQEISSPTKSCQKDM